MNLFRFTGDASPAGSAADDWLSEALQRKVRLVWLDDPTRRRVNPDYSEDDDRVSFADGYPVALANMASLANLNDLIAESGSLEGPLPMTRFRPNLVIAGAPAWVEDEWSGRRIRIGEVTFRVPEADRPVSGDHHRPGVRGQGQGAAADARPAPQRRSGPAVRDEPDPRQPRTYRSRRPGHPALTVTAEAHVCQSVRHCDCAGEGTRTPTPEGTAT